MKTSMKSMILLAVIALATISAAFASNSDNRKNPGSVTTVVRYVVKIQNASDINACNLYQVEILDAAGYQVVPAKIFVRGVSEYQFYERGPVRGARIARLVPAPIDGTGPQKDGHGFRCNHAYFTAPAMLPGPFQNGQTYQFELFPQEQAAE